PSVVALKNIMVDVCQAVANDLAAPVNPYFAPQNPVAMLAGKTVAGIDDFCFRHDPSYHP
ncbi:MAG: hypothetical protein Q8J67_01940, partial [Rhodocyclaceae bacterium]|nr:hypothetical protein [Rhodocyclaceae bacterium]